jgi:hypothetical protein
MLHSKTHLSLYAREEPFFFFHVSGKCVGKKQNQVHHANVLRTGSCMSPSPPFTPDAGLFCLLVALEVLGGRLEFELPSSLKGPDILRCPDRQLLIHWLPPALRSAPASTK